MILDQEDLPGSVKAECLRILKLINDASDNNTVVQSGLLAEGVVRGFEVLSGLYDFEIEALYVLFENAVNLRLGELSCTACTEPQKLIW
jgi:hypothetical protein